MEVRARITSSVRMHKFIVEMKLKLILSSFSLTVPS